MKKNNLYQENGVIELSYLINKFWEKKFFILFISILCGFLGCIYFFFSVKELKTEIIINKPPANIFNSYTNPVNIFYSYTNLQDGFHDKFFYIYENNFLSIDNLNNFIKQSPEVNSFFDARNINVNKYFKEKLTKIKEKEIKFSARYLLIFPKQIDGISLLDNYAKFILNKTVIEFKKELEQELVRKINLIKLIIEVKKVSNQEFQQNLSSKPNNLNSYNISENLLAKEAKDLFLEVEFYKKLLQNLESEKFNYNFSDKLEKNSEEVSKNIFFYFFSGLIVGLFLSLTFFFFKIF